MLVPKHGIWPTVVGHQVYVAGGGTNAGDSQRSSMEVLTLSAATTTASTTPASTDATTASTAATTEPVTTQPATTAAATTHAATTQPATTEATTQPASTDATTEPTTTAATTEASTASTALPPCSNEPTSWMVQNGYTCESWGWMYANRCGSPFEINPYSEWWTSNHFCAQSCFENGNGYADLECGIREGFVLASASDGGIGGADGDSGMSSVERASILGAVVGMMVVVMAGVYKYRRRSVIVDPARGAGEESIEPSSELCERRATRTKGARESLESHPREVIKWDITRGDLEWDVTV